MSGVTGIVSTFTDIDAQKFIQIVEEVRQCLVPPREENYLLVLGSKIDELSNSIIVKSFPHIEQALQPSVRNFILSLYSVGQEPEEVEEARKGVYTQMNNLLNAFFYDRIIKSKWGLSLGKAIDEFDIKRLREFSSTSYVPIDYLQGRSLRNPLSQAAVQGDEKAVTKLLEICRPNLQVGIQDPVLFDVIRCDSLYVQQKINILRLLLAKGANPMERSVKDWPSWHINNLYLLGVPSEILDLLFSHSDLKQSKDLQSKVSMLDEMVKPQVGINPNTISRVAIQAIFYGFEFMNEENAKQYALPLAVYIKVYTPQKSEWDNNLLLTDPLLNPKDPEGQRSRDPKKSPLSEFLPSVAHVVIELIQGYLREGKAEFRQRVAIECQRYLKMQKTEADAKENAGGNGNGQ